MSEPINKELLASLIDAEALYHNAPCGYVSFIPDGTVVKINQTLLTWLGYTAEEVLYQKKFPNFITRGGNIHFEMFFRPMLGVSGSVKELSYELVTKDGFAFPVLLGAVTVKDEKGSIMAINAILTDNTDRKRYEKEILQAKRFAEAEKKTFQFLADLIPEMIWTATPDGKIDYVNQRFIQYFNLPDKNFSLNTILSKIYAEDRKKFIVTWTNKIRSGEDLFIELQLENGQNEFEWHLVKANAYVNEENQLVKWFGSCSNINDHRRALKQKDEFISIASHELKTPVTSLMATLQLLDRIKSAPSPKMLPGLIEQANRNVKKVNVLIADLLNVSQMNEGQLHLNKSWFNMSELIGGCCQHVRMGGKYELMTSGDEQLQVFADEGRIEQVVINLVNNAVKYAPDSKRITVALEQTGQELKVSVTDEGPGITAEKIPHLFDRYYRVDSAGSKYSGLGLGLYICSEIIKKHQGRIGVNSLPGKGSTFWFTLPLAES
jgi:PAS domain S-box-containing protein